MPQIGGSSLRMQFSALFSQPSNVSKTHLRTVHPTFSALLDPSDLLDCKMTPFSAVSEVPRWFEAQTSSKNLEASPSRNASARTASRLRTRRVGGIRHTHEGKNTHIHGGATPILKEKKNRFSTDHGVFQIKPQVMRPVKASFPSRRGVGATPRSCPVP